MATNVMEEHPATETADGQVAALVHELETQGAVRLPALVSDATLRDMQAAFNARLQGMRWNNHDGYERTERMRLDAALSLSGPRALVMILEGKGKIAGEPYEKGEGWRLLRNLTIEPSRATTLLYVTWPE